MWDYKNRRVKVIRNFAIDFENIAIILWILIIPKVLDESISRFLKNDNIYNVFFFIRTLSTN